MSSFCTAKATHIFSAKKFQHICVSLNINFNVSLTNDVVSFEQLGPDATVTRVPPKDIRWYENANLSLHCSNAQTSLYTHHDSLHELHNCSRPNFIFFILTHCRLNQLCPQTPPHYILEESISILGMSGYVI